MKFEYLFRLEDQKGSAKNVVHHLYTNQFCCHQTPFFKKKSWKKNSLLFNKNEPWFKKENFDFDLTMGSFDGAEACEIEQIYFLDISTKEFSDNKFSLCRYDELSCFQYLSGS